METEDLSEALARIVAEAQTNHRPRQLFGVQLGPVSRPPAPAPAPAPQPIPAPAEKPGPVRVEAYKQCYQIIWEQLQHRATPNHPWSLVHHSAEPESALGLLDALETHLIRGGAEKMQTWLQHMSANHEASVALSAMLASTASVCPERVVGMLLLTSDAAGGCDTLAGVLDRLAQGVDSSLHLAQCLETCSRTGRAGQGLMELLTALSEPGQDDWSRSGTVAGCLRGLSATVGGARRLAQTLENLTQVEDGPAQLARLLHRLCRTGAGAEATLVAMRNLSSDKPGAHQLGRILARLAAGRIGAAELLHVFQALPGRPFARLLVDLSEGGETARFLAQLARDPGHAYRLQYLFDQLHQDGRSRKLLRYALQQMAGCPRQHGHYQLLAARLDAAGPLEYAC